jgi:XTP/dITP diphosphohydrolase
MNKLLARTDQSRTAHQRRVSECPSYDAIVADLLLASQNPGKLNEMRQLVDGLPYRVLGPRDVGIRDAPEETGTTFLENATLKAVHYARLSGVLTVADDSGLSVDALAGAPGLYSSRFGGEGASDLARNRLLLEKLKDVPWEGRGASFTSAVVVARDVDVLFRAQEQVAGLIAFEMRGTQGFGYDPLFFYPPFGRTFGESLPADKDRVSHRGKAFARLRAFLADLR